MTAEPFPQLGLGHAIAGDLLALEEEHWDLEDVLLLELGVVADVQLHERKAATSQSALDHLPHLVAEVAFRLADQGEHGAVDGGAQEVERSGAGARRRRVRTPAPTMIDTIVNCTSRPVRSGWMPIQGTSGKGTGRGGR